MYLYAVEYARDNYNKNFKEIYVFFQYFLHINNTIEKSGRITKVYFIIRAVFLLYFKPLDVSKSKKKNLICRAGVKFFFASKFLANFYLLIYNSFTLPIV